MARLRKDFGARKHVRVDLYKPGFLIPAPEAPWIECLVLDVSDRGVCREVGALAVPKIFGLAFTADGEVFRVCWLVWRRGELIGAASCQPKSSGRGLSLTTPISSVGRLPPAEAAGETIGANYRRAAAPGSDRTRKALTFYFDAFSLREKLSAPDRVRGELSFERAPSIDSPTRRIRNTGRLDSSRSSISHSESCLSLREIPPTILAQTLVSSCQAALRSANSVP
jgi:hypothetical protein